MTSPSTTKIQLRLPKLLDWQRTVDQNTARFQVLACGRRVGKTTYSKRRIAKQALYTGLPYAYFAPTYKMLDEVWRGMVNGLRDVTSEKRVQEKQIILLSGGVVDFWSLENPDAARGRKYAGIVVDEAAMVRALADTWAAVLRPLLTDYQGWAMFPSTPRGRNAFWELYQRGIDPLQPEWSAWRLPTAANPLIEPGEIEAARQELPERIFAQEYLAEFLEGNGVVFRRVNEAAIAPHAAPDDHAGHDIVIGADWGKMNDFTVLTASCRQCRCMVDFDRFNQIDYVFQVERLASMVAKWHGAIVHAETNSMGEAVIEQVERRGIRVVRFTTTAQSKPPLIESLALALERGEYAIQDIPVLVGELQAYTMTMNKITGRASYSAPDGMNDDTVMSLALSWHGIVHHMSSLIAFV